MNNKSSIKFGLTPKQYDLIINAIIKIKEIERVIIFGSRVTDKFKPSSDIDLTIIGKDVNYRIANRLYSELDELPLPFMFDIIDYAEISNNNLKNKIDLQGKIFFDRQLTTA